MTVLGNQAGIDLANQENVVLLYHFISFVCVHWVI